MNSIYYDILKLKTPVNAKPILISTNIALFRLKSPSDISLSVYKPSKKTLKTPVNAKPILISTNIALFRLKSPSDISLSVYKPSKDPLGRGINPGLKSDSLRYIILQQIIFFSIVTVRAALCLHPSGLRQTHYRLTPPRQEYPNQT